MPEDKSPFKRLFQQTDVIFTFALFGIVMLLVLPISSVLMDLLLAISIGLSLLILLIVIYLKNPSESIFIISPFSNSYSTSAKSDKSYGIPLIEECLTDSRLFVNCAILVSRMIY